MESYTAIGLMSGTSLDGIDVALIRTNGTDQVEFGPALTVDYDVSFVKRLRKHLGATSGCEELEQDLTLLHVKAVKALLDQENLKSTDIDVIGFHGHTLHHDPAKGITVQIGDGALLAKQLGISVVNDFRSQDVRAGGQGAPLVPIFHQALVGSQNEVSSPVAVVNIGGVANVTWVGDDLLAFDTGPGNAPLNDWVQRHTEQNMDRNGVLAEKGTVNAGVLRVLLENSYFDKLPPKSLDRDDFKVDLKGLNLEDGARTLTAFIAKSIAKAKDFFPTPVNTWVICGGGRLNPVLMEMLQNEIEAKVMSADDLGWDGDALEAQAFSYLAVRHKRGLPITFPNTTGVKEPLSGGVLHIPT
ncbi:MAG: anhydro-N-acetylmuramic acid kinase [Rhodospirillaceae bacterium]|nr:MAG: anhydro-N-acetylmuramic acid kinase [Rhodospirillaceae bacterium]